MRSPARRRLPKPAASSRPRAPTSSAARCNFLDHMLAVIAENADFEALKLARQIIREDAAVEF